MLQLEVLIAEFLAVDGFAAGTLRLCQLVVGMAPGPGEMVGAVRTNSRYHG